MQLYWLSHLFPLSLSLSRSISLSLSLTTTWVAFKSTISLILIVQLSPRFMLFTLKLVRAWSNQKASSQNRSWAYKIKLLIWFKPLAFGCNRRRWSILDLDNHFKLCFMLQDAAGFLEGIYSWKGNICGHRRRMERESLSAWFPSSFITKIHFPSHPFLWNWAHAHMKMRHASWKQKKRGKRYRKTRKC